MPNTHNIAGLTTILYNFPSTFTDIFFLLPKIPVATSNPATFNPTSYIHHTISPSSCTTDLKYIWKRFYFINKSTSESYVVITPRLNLIT